MTFSSAECKHDFGDAPRSFSFRIPKPPWLLEDKADAMHGLFEAMPEVFKNGVVLWGHIVQANQQMFDRGTDNCPGEVLYSLEDTDKATPDCLQHVAESVHSLKDGSYEDPDLNRVADYLTDEMTRVFGRKVPEELSPGVRCRLSSILFVRQHLPEGRLLSPLLPIVVSPTEPHYAMVVPEKHWTAEFRDWWRQGQRVTEYSADCFLGRSQLQSPADRTFILERPDRQTVEIHFPRNLKNKWALLLIGVGALVTLAHVPWILGLLGMGPGGPGDGYVLGASLAAMPIGICFWLGRQCLTIDGYQVTKAIRLFGRPVLKDSMPVEEVQQICAEDDKNDAYVRLYNGDGGQLHLESFVSKPERDWFMGILNSSLPDQAGPDD